MNKEALRRAAAAFSVELDAEMTERFAVYAAFLREYNEKINLTAITQPDEIAVKHFEDSLAVLHFVQPAVGASVADVGTGAGFPGVPLLIARQDINLTLIEATNKKLVFLTQLLERLGLRAQTVHMRAEEAGQDARYRENYALVTARAVAELCKLAEYCMPLVHKNGCFAAMKAQTAAQELQDAASALRILGGADTAQYNYTLSNGDSRTLLVTKKISRTSTKYPRPSGVITKKPL